MNPLNPTLFQRVHRIQFYAEKLATDLLAGAYRSAFKGRGMEFEDVREYLAGDEIRSIDWNVTARLNQPYVKNFREERELTVMLIIDISASTHFGSKQLKKETIAEIGALLAFSAIKNGDKIGLILFSDRIETYIPPRKGSRHAMRLVRELLADRPAHKPTNLIQALQFFGQVQKKACIAFLISDFLTEAAQNEYRLLSKKHDLIAVAIRDALEESFPPLGLIHLQDLETGQRQLVDTKNNQFQQAYRQGKDQVLQQHRHLLEKFGAGFIEIKNDDSYPRAIQSYFKQRAKRR